MALYHLSIESVLRNVTLKVRKCRTSSTVVHDTKKNKLLIQNVSHIIQTRYVLSATRHLSVLETNMFYSFSPTVFNSWKFSDTSFDVDLKLIWINVLWINKQAIHNHNQCIGYIYIHSHAMIMIFVLFHYGFVFIHRWTWFTIHDNISFLVASTWLLSREHVRFNT